MPQIWAVAEPAILAHVQQLVSLAQPTLFDVLGLRTFPTRHRTSLRMTSTAVENSVAVSGGREASGAHISPAPPQLARRWPLSTRIRRPDGAYFRFLGTLLFVKSVCYCWVG